MRYLMNTGAEAERVRERWVVTWHHSRGGTSSIKSEAAVGGCSCLPLGDKLKSRRDSPRYVRVYCTCDTHTHLSLLSTAIHASPDHISRHTHLSRAAIHLSSAASAAVRSTRVTYAKRDAASCVSLTPSRMGRPRSTRVTPVSGAVIEMVGQPAGTAREIDSSASEPASPPFGPRGRSAESSASDLRVVRRRRKRCV